MSHYGMFPCWFQISPYECRVKFRINTKTSTRSFNVTTSYEPPVINRPLWTQNLCKMWKNCADWSESAKSGVNVPLVLQEKKYLIQIFSYLSLATETLSHLEYHQPVLFLLCSRVFFAKVSTFEHFVHSWLATPLLTTRMNSMIEKQTLIKNSASKLKLGSFTGKLHAYHDSFGEAIPQMKKQRRSFWPSRYNY